MGGIPSKLGFVRVVVAATTLLCLPGTAFAHCGPGEGGGGGGSFDRFNLSDQEIGSRCKGSSRYRECFNAYRQVRQSAQDYLNEMGDAEKSLKEFEAQNGCAQNPNQAACAQASQELRHMGGERHRRLAKMAHECAGKYGESGKYDTSGSGDKQLADAGAFSRDFSDTMRSEAEQHRTASTAAPSGEVVVNFGTAQTESKNDPNNASTIAMAEGPADKPKGTTAPKAAPAAPAAAAAAQPASFVDPGFTVASGSAGARIDSRTISSLQASTASLSPLHPKAAQNDAPAPEAAASASDNAGADTVTPVASGELRGPFAEEVGNAEARADFVSHLASDDRFRSDMTKRLRESIASGQTDPTTASLVKGAISQAALQARAKRELAGLKPGVDSPFTMDASGTKGELARLLGDDELAEQPDYLASPTEPLFHRVHGSIARHFLKGDVKRPKIYRLGGE
jgi:hypothetical protein